MRGLAPKFFAFQKFPIRLPNPSWPILGVACLGGVSIILSSIRDVYSWGPAVDLQADYCWPQPYTYLFHFILRVQSLEVFGRNTVLWAKSVPCPRIALGTVLGTVLTS